MRLLGRGRRDGAAQVDVDLALADAHELAAHSYRFRARLESSLEARCLVRGDLAQLTQAFTHLLTNAALALPDGQLETNLIRVTSRRDGARVELTFEDNGPGISEALRPHVFEPFFTTRRAAGHVGLGLPICLAVVEAFGGTLALDSTWGRGCTVRVRFPVAGELSAPAVVAAAPPDTHLTPAPRPARPTVLIIDDEAIIANSLRRMLKREYEVEVMTDSEAAVAHLETRAEYDVVLCDLMMPRLTGAEVYQTVVGRHPHLRSRFVFMTGGTYTDSIREFLARAHVPVLDKPFDLERLHALLEACVAKGRGG
jgi:CheY-like chemotaxis protein/anti-sigma regulatory factor (Ser/Thr protein kinase)